MSNTDKNDKRIGRWKKGESGNPNGRPKSDNSQMRDKLRQAMPEIIDKLIELAKAGDTHAIKVIMDKTVPNIKPVGASVLIGGLIPSDTPENQAKAITSAMAGGLIDTSTAGDMMSVIERQMKIVEVSELAKRVEQLELGL